MANRLKVSGRMSVGRFEKEFEDEFGGAMNTEEGVAAEYEYLAEEFGIPEIDWKFIRQSLIPT